MIRCFVDFIGQIQVIDDRIDHHLEKAERLRSLCDRVTTIWSDEVVHMSSENLREQHLAELIDSKRELADLLNERKRVYEEVRSWLYGNLPLEYASILEYRFIDRLPLGKIADRMGYAEQTIKNKSSMAVKEARLIYERSIK